VKWRKSKAKRILYDLLLDGTVPLDNTILVDVFLLTQPRGLNPSEKSLLGWTKGPKKTARLLMFTTRITRYLTFCTKGISSGKDPIHRSW
jgi:hypothetical protein